MIDPHDLGHLVLGGMSAALAALIGTIWRQIDKKLDRLMSGQETHSRSLAIAETRIESHGERLDMLEKRERGNGAFPRGTA